MTKKQIQIKSKQIIELLGQIGWEIVDNKEITRPGNLAVDFPITGPYKARIISRDPPFALTEWYRVLILRRKDEDL